MTRAHSPSTSDAAVEKATGKTWRAWFAILDAWGGAAKGHRAMARHLHEAHGVAAWWSQTVTVEYERARGLRAVGERASGEYEAGVQRTVKGTERAVREAWLDADRVRALVKGVGLPRGLAAAAAKARVSDTAMGSVLRFEVGGAGARERVEVMITPKGKECVVRVTHRGLASAEAREGSKERWRVVLERLQVSFAD